MHGKHSLLDPDFVPERELVVHRRDELEELLNSYRGAFSGSSQTYLYGPQGCGKTLLARLSLQIARDEKGGRPAYVNCWKHRSRADILFEIADQVCSQTFHRHSTSRGVVASALMDEPADSRWVVLDEVSELKSADVLYDLARAPELHIVLVANEPPYILSDADARIRSRIDVGKRI
ncbi:MAG: AAA family ATPase [Halovenus sp.]